MKNEATPSGEQDGKPSTKPSSTSPLPTFIMEKLTKAEAGEALSEAWIARDEAWTAYGKVCEALSEADAAYHKAWAAHDKAEKAYDKVTESRQEKAKHILAFLVVCHADQYTGLDDPMADDCSKWIANLTDDELYNLVLAAYREGI